MVEGTLKGMVVHIGFTDGANIGFEGKRIVLYGWSSFRSVLLKGPVRKLLPLIFGNIRNLCQNIIWLTFSRQDFLNEGSGALISRVAQTPYFAVNQIEFQDQTNLWPSLWGALLCMKSSVKTIITKFSGLSFFTSCWFCSCIVYCCCQLVELSIVRVLKYKL